MSGTDYGLVLWERVVKGGEGRHRTDQVMLEIEPVASRDIWFIPALPEDLSVGVYRHFFGLKDARCSWNLTKATMSLPEDVGVRLRLVLHRVRSEDSCEASRETNPFRDSPLFALMGTMIVGALFRDPS